MAVVGYGLEGLPVFGSGFDVLGRLRVIPLFLVEGPRADLNPNAYHNNRWDITMYPLLDQ